MDLSVILFGFLIAIFVYMLVDRICATAEHIAIAKYMPDESHDALAKAFHAKKAGNMATFGITKDGKVTPLDDENKLDISPAILGAVADYFRVLKAQKENELEEKHYYKKDDE